MSVYVVSGSYLSDIADAIRVKTGTSDTMTIDEMPQKITDISSVNFDNVNVTAADVLAPKVFIDKDGNEQSGTMPTNNLVTPSVSFDNGVFTSTVTQATGYVEESTTSNSLIIPDSWGELNFKIVGGTTQPESLTQNLIIYRFSDTTKTTNGITFTDNGDGTITANGTATANAAFMVTNALDALCLTAGETYTLSGCPAGGSENSYYLQMVSYDTDPSTWLWDYGSDFGAGLTVTAADEADSKGLNAFFRIVIMSGTTVSNLVFKPQLEKGSEATAFVRYSQKEDTIWVNTGTEITSWDFSASEPLRRSGNKNLLCYPFYHTTLTENGVTWKDNKNGTVTATGTATGTSRFRWSFHDDCVLLEPGTYTASGCPAGGSASTYYFELWDEEEGVNVAKETGSGVTFVLTRPTKVRGSLLAFSGVSLSGAVFKPQIEKGSAATAFVKGDATGQLWIQTGLRGVLSLNALKKNAIKLYPLKAKQYIGGAWVTKAAQSYQGEAWSEWVTWLYNAGNQMTDLTGGWKTSGIKAGSSWTATAPTLNLNANNMYTVLGAVSGANIAGYTYTANKISLADVTTIYFSGSTTGSSNFYPALVVASTVSSSTTLTIAAVKWSLANGNTLDVSSLTGSYHVGFYLRAVEAACSVTCTELYGE